MNNYKEWKKYMLKIPVTDSIKRGDLASLQEEDNYATIKYEEGCPWYNYIRDNMIV